MFVGNIPKTAQYFFLIVLRPLIKKNRIGNFQQKNMFFGSFKKTVGFFPQFFSRLYRRLFKNFHEKFWKKKNENFPLKHCLTSPWSFSNFRKYNDFCMYFKTLSIFSPFFLLSHKMIKKTIHDKLSKINSGIF